MANRKQTQKTNAPARRAGPKSIDWKPAFLAALAETGQCSRACNAAQVDNSTVYRRRQSDPEFATAYSECLAMAAELLEAEAVRRAKDGLRRMKFNSKTGEAYIDPSTGQPYVEHEYSDTLLLALLKRFFPKEYRERQDVKMEHGGQIDHHIVLTEETRKKLMEQRKAALEGSQQP